MYICYSEFKKRVRMNGRLKWFGNGPQTMFVFRMLSWSAGRTKDTLKVIDFASCSRYSRRRRQADVRYILSCYVSFPPGLVLFTGFQDPSQCSRTRHFKCNATWDDAMGSSWTIQWLAGDFAADKSPGNTPWQNSKDIKYIKISPHIMR